MRSKIYSLIVAVLISGLVSGPVPVFSAGQQFEFLMNQVRYASGSLAGGKVYFYEVGTTTLKPVYTNVAATDNAANPYTLDSNGTALLYGNGTYRVVIKTAAGVTVYDRDNVKVEDLMTSLTDSSYGTTIRPGNVVGDGTDRISGFSFGASNGTDNGSFANLIVKNSPYIDVRANASGTSGIPDDGLDDSAAFVSTLSGGNKTVLIPDGQWEIGGSTTWLTVEDNTTILMGRHAILNFTGDNTTYRYGFRLFGVSNVKIIGGILKGNRTTQSSGTGIGILVSGGLTAGSDNILIQDVVVKDWYTDGFLIGGGITDVTNVKLVHSTATNNRRNGASIVGDAKDILVDGCTFESTNGTSPQAGLDIEPDATYTAENITVVNSIFRNNTSSGLIAQDGLGTTKRVTLGNNWSYGNGGYAVAVTGVDTGSASGVNGWNNTLGGWYFSGASNWDVRGGAMDNNAINLEVNASTDLYFGGGLKLLNSVGDDGAVVRLNSGRITMDGIHVRGSGAHGVNLDNVYDSKLVNSTVTTSQQVGVRLATTVDNCSVSNNIVRDNNQAAGTNDGINVAAGNYCRIAGNTVGGAHRYHINVGPSAVGNVVEGNDISDASATTAKFIDSSSSTTVRGNKRGAGAGNGRATLADGTVTVSTTEVVAADSISLTRVVAGGTGRGASLEVGTIVAGTSFVINSVDASASVVTTDNSVVYWEIRH